MGGKRFKKLNPVMKRLKKKRIKEQEEIINKQEKKDIEQASFAGKETLRKEIPKNPAESKQPVVSQPLPPQNQKEVLETSCIEEQDIFNQQFNGLSKKQEIKKILEIFGLISALPHTPFSWEAIDRMLELASCFLNFGQSYCNFFLDESSFYKQINSSILYGLKRALRLISRCAIENSQNPGLSVFFFQENQGNLRHWFPKNYGEFVLQHRSPTSPGNKIITTDYDSTKLVVNDLPAKIAKDRRVLLGDDFDSEIGDWERSLNLILHKLSIIYVYKSRLSVPYSRGIILTLVKLTALLLRKYVDKEEIDNFEAAIKALILELYNEFTILIRCADEMDLISTMQPNLGYYTVPDQYFDYLFSPEAVRWYSAGSQWHRFWSWFLPRGRGFWKEGILVD